MITKQEKGLIEAAVKAAEERTSGEVVPLVVAASGDHNKISYRLGALGLMLGTGLAIWAHYRFPFLEVYQLFSLQLWAAIAAWLFGRLPSAIRIFAGEARLAVVVHDAALAAFTRHGLHQTKKGTGILIYVSLLEHRVEILADSGINAKVGEDFWRIEVQKLVLGIREKRAAATLALVIKEIGEKLREHFPGEAGDINELPNDLRSR